MIKQRLLLAATFFTCLSAEAQFTKVPGFQGGDVRDLLYTGGVLYAQNAAQSSNQLYTSTDLGATWQNISPGMRLYPYTHARLVKIGTKLFVGPAQSVNNGASWTMNPNIFLNMEKAVGSNGNFYGFQWIGGERKVMRSTDALTTIAPIATATVPIDTFNNFRDMFATATGVAIQTKNKLMHSIDGGNTWTQLPTPIAAAQYNTIMLMKVSGTDIYYTTTLDDSVHVSTNMGATWSAIYTQGYGVVDVVRSGTKYYIARSQLSLMTADLALTKVATPLNGNFYTMMGSLSVYSFLERMQYIDANTILMTTNNMGVLKFNPTTTTYSLMNNGLTMAGVTVIGGNNNVVLAVKKHHNYEKSTNKGLNWTADTAAAKVIHSEYSQPATTVISFNNKIYVGATGDQRVYVTGDNALTWKNVQTGLNTQIGGLFPGILDMTAHNNVLYAGANNGHVYKMITDTSWMALGNPSPSRNPVTGIVSLGTTLFASTDQKVGGNPGSIYKSVDNGQTWTLSAGTIAFTNVISLEVNNGKLIASCGSKGNYRSDDNGASWQPIDNGLPVVGGFAVNTMMGLQSFNNRVYGILTGGVLTDSFRKLWYYDVPLNKWTCESCSQPALDLTAFHVTDSVIYLGTDGDGVWRKAVVPTGGPGPGTSVSLFESTDDGILLYPNPSASPTIQFLDKSMAQSATIAVLDNSGKVVMRETMNGPVYILKAGALSAGIYYVEVIREGRVVAVKRWVKE